MLDKLFVFLKKADIVFLFSFISISFFGLFTMSNFEAGNLYYNRQIIWIIFGVFIYVIFSRINFRFLQNTNLVLLFYCISNMLILATIFLGATLKGSKAWLDFGLFSLQPSDIMKISLIILLAKYFSKRHIEIKNIRHIIVSFIYTAIPVFLILLQPDFGSAIVLLFIWFSMVMASGLSKKHFFTLLVLGVFSLAFLWNIVFANYQKERILNFFNPMKDIRGSGYNVYQSNIAIGSGGIFGKNVGFGTQSRLNFLPEHETDFIYAAFAEEWGFVGSLVLFILLIIIMIRMLFIASINYDNFSIFFMLGVFFWFFVHILINIGMNLGLMPVTGLPLPFMSYGGSHYISEVLALSMVNAMNQNKVNFKNKNINNEFLGVE